MQVFTSISFSFFCRSHSQGYISHPQCLSFWHSPSLLFIFVFSVIPQTFAILYNVINSILLEAVSISPLFSKNFLFLLSVSFCFPFCPLSLGSLTVLPKCLKLRMCAQLVVSLILSIIHHNQQK